MFTKPALSIAGAKAAAAGAIAEAEKRGIRVTVAIVDDGGHLIYFERMDGCRLCAIEAATAKARTSALFRRATKIYEDALMKGSTILLGMPDMLPAEGGMPLYYGGASVGAIGVSGAPQLDDGAVAAAAVTAFETA